jgi:aspartyl-tRNA synthetase
VLKSHGCGELRASHAGEPVRLAGWVHAHRDHGGVIFLDLRDASGLVQVVCSQAEAHRLRAEWCIAVEGDVRARPAGTENPKLATGDVEVVASSLEVLATAPPLPFQIEDDVAGEESLRLRYRYLDIRRAPMLDALRTRARIIHLMHLYLTERGFLDVETPVLARSTPEGSRDFLVPSRLQKGEFYALTQSPQLFKQILMVGGVERYYQIARCLRDEDLRANRQPEFTQLDLEMSFVEPSDIQSLIDGLMQLIWRECLGAELETPFPRLAYDSAIERFGTDKPDLRAGPEIVDLTAAFAGTEFKAFAGAEAIRGLRAPGSGSSSRAQLDSLIERAKELGAKGLVWMVVEPDELRAPVAKFMSAGELDAIRSKLGGEPGDLLLLMADAPRTASEVLGELRLELARSSGRIRSLSDPADWKFVWIVDWPLFEWLPEESRWDAMHNPFSRPTDETEALIGSDPGKCRSYQYDLVLNGEETAGGALRNHKASVQLAAFVAMGIPEHEVREKFGFFLDALTYGAPPHGGIAMGLDRLVRVMCGGASIRDVIAFPKTQTGSDPLTGAPSAVAAEQLRELGIRLVQP